MAKLMNWNNFEKQLKEKKLLLFSPLDITRLFGISKVAATFLVHRYVQKMFIRRVRRGLYVFPGLLPPDLYLANKLYEPSYISLEFALSYHRVIPETVYEITSVTTKSTRCFTALGKIFSYHSLKQDAFTGYILEKQDGFTYLIAEPEKAFVDCMYLRAKAKKELLQRFDKERINKDKALQYTGFFKNDNLTRIIEKALA